MLWLDAALATLGPVTSRLMGVAAAALAVCRVPSPCASVFDMVTVLRLGTASTSLVMELHLCTAWGARGVRVSPMGQGMPGWAPRAVAVFILLAGGLLPGGVALTPSTSPLIWSAPILGSKTALLGSVLFALPFLSPMRSATAGGVAPLLLRASLAVYVGL